MAALDYAGVPTHEQDLQVDQKALKFIYVAHFFARWGAGIWDFSVALFMMTIFPKSLALTASYGLAETLTLTLFGVFVGDWVDRNPDLKIFRLSVVLRNGCTLLASLMILILLLQPAAYFLPTLVASIDVLGAVAALAGLACDILLERDWVVKLAGDSPELLVEMNTVMRRIDLTCKVLAPAFVGVLMSTFSVLVSVLVISIWNLTTLGIEYWLLYSAYSALPALRGDSAPQTAEDEEVPEQTQQTTKCNIFSSFLHGFLVYMKQDSMLALAGLALALLYFTVLSFGSLMTASLQWRGLPAFVIGIARGVSACIGIVSTAFYPRMHQMVGTVRSGLWSIWMQWFCLVLSVASLWVASVPVSLALLLSGVILSRFGLWMFDLAVTQLMQSAVPEAERGLVGGVQNSLQSLMNMMTYIMAILVSHPQDFGKLVLLSFSSVSTAAMLYSFFSYKIRGHLFHLEKLCCQINWYSGDAAAPLLH